MIEVERKQFSRALQLAGAAVGCRTNIPVLAMVKATANGALALEATDLDNATRVELPYTGEEGEFLLPEPAMMRSAINLSGGDVVRITPVPADGRESARIKLNASKYRADLVSRQADDHPGGDKVHYEEFGADIGASELSQVARIMPAISTEETRYYLNGVCVSKVGDWLYRFTATDGHRLMMVDVPLPSANGEIPDGTIIPRQWLQIALRHFPKAKAGAKLIYGRGLVRNHEEGRLSTEAPGSPRIALSADLDGLRFCLTGKLIDGTYPDVNRVIPAGSDIVARVARAELIQAVKAVRSFGGGRVRAVRLSFSGRSITCSQTTPEFGSDYRIAAEHNAQDGFAIGFNGQYLLDACSALRGDEVEFGMTDPGAPVLITDPSDTAFRVVQMPMRV